MFLSPANAVDITYSLSHAQIIDLEARIQFINQQKLFVRQSAHVNQDPEHLSV